MNDALRAAMLQPSETLTSKSPRRSLSAGFLFQTSGNDYSLVWRFFRAAPRMSPSEAPESDEPN
ncbi:hypothetical protein BLJAPNOD_00413 [Ensifer sp. M14]|nr:hypothetical protein BLJAPNOD_00413 [Ensifer sp. M14]